MATIQINICIFEKERERELKERRIPLKRYMLGTGEISCGRSSGWIDDTILSQLNMFHIHVLALQIISTVNKNRVS